MEARPQAQSPKQQHFGYSRMWERQLYSAQGTAVAGWPGPQEVTAYQMAWAPGKDKVERRMITAFLLPCLWPRVPTQLASGIKAPEEGGHGHHEQGIDIDHTGPAPVLTDVLQAPGCCIHLLQGGGWGTACPAPAHSTEPEQAPVEQAWCCGLGLWEKLKPYS